MGHIKDHWDLILKNLSDWNFKNLTEFPFGNWNFHLEFQSYKWSSEWHFHSCSSDKEKDTKMQFSLQAYCSKFSHYYNTYIQLATITTHTYNSTLNTIFHILVRSHHDEAARVSNSYKLLEAVETPFAFKIIAYPLGGSGRCSLLENLKKMNDWLKFPTCSMSFKVLSDPDLFVWEGGLLPLSFLTQLEWGYHH